MPKRRTVLTGWLEPPQLDEAVPVACEPSLEGKPRAAKTIQQTLYLPPAVHDQLRSLAFHKRVKMHTIILEGLDKVFQENGLKSISDLSPLT